jgi:MFS family permease
VAHWLNDRGFEAYAVRGGVAALRGEAPPADEDDEAASRATEGEGRRGVLAAFRHRPFRLYSAGLLLCLVGTWVEASAFGYVVLLLGGSASTLGVIGFLSTIPNLALTLPGGALADRYDGRKLLLGFQTVSMAVPTTLAVLWATDNLTVPLMGALALAGGVLGALSFPAFQAVLASTVPREDLESAVAVNSIALQLARFAGPAIAGILLAAAGPFWIFATNAASFPLLLAVLALLPSARTGARATGERLTRAMSEGIRYVLEQRSMASLMLLTALAGLFATPVVAFMLPAIVREQLDAGGGTLGALTAAIGLGSLVGSAALLLLARRPNKGEPVLAGYVLTSAAIAVIGVSTSVPLSLLVAFVGGLCGVVFVGLSTVVVQAMSSDEMRARAMAIWAAAFVGVLPLGALLTAALTEWLGPGGAVVVDGLVTLVGGLGVVALRPEVRWLGCAALPEACVAATDPAAVALEEELLDEAAAPA